MKKEVNSSGNGILIIVFGDNPEMLKEAEEDKDIFIQYSESPPKLVQCKTISQLSDTITNYRPELLHLLAKFNGNGRLIDYDGKSIGFGEIMKLSETSGVHFLISASENNFELIGNEIIDSKNIDLMTIVQRNRHYSSFLSGLVKEISNTRSFAMAYVKLAPQHESVQKGLPLPGSIAICPTKDGKRIVLWTNAQE